MQKLYADIFTEALTLELLTNEYADWIRAYGNGRNSNDLRFGQYLINKYGAGKSCPEIFYEESARQVYVILGLDWI